MNISIKGTTPAHAVKISTALMIPATDTRLLPADWGSGCVDCFMLSSKTLDHNRRDSAAAQQQEKHFAESTAGSRQTADTAGVLQARLAIGAYDAMTKGF